MTDPLITSLLRALDAAPEDLPLRVHVAELLVRAGRGEEAIGHLAAVLASEPGNERARELMAAAMGGGPPRPATPQERAPATPLERAPATPFDWRSAEEQVGARHALRDWNSAIPSGSRRRWRPVPSTPRGRPWSARRSR